MPFRTSATTPARILTAAADHIERVGLYQGDELWQPGEASDAAPCTVLYAWERSVRAARPSESAGEEAWEVFHGTFMDSLVVLSDHMNERPVQGRRWRELGLMEDSYRCLMVWCWGNEPGRTAGEAVAVLRAAAHVYRSGGDRCGGGCPGD
ncbi:DUF6197 family protein [Streptomyces sp. NPDC093109]|uniref:DUF6197 family protein n=1 Tax=Streptomyces sp. NPDC093109 TaxID=3154977 RepID=UPI00344DA664